MYELNLLNRARESKIKLWVEDGQLKFSSPKGSLTPELKQELIQHKSGLIQLLSQLSESKDEELRGQTAIKSCARSGPLALSYSQQRLWLLEHMELGGAHYNIPVALELAGNLNIQALEQGLAMLVERHECLRTLYKSVNGSPVVEIRADSDFVVSHSDLSGLPQDQREQSAKQLVSDLSAYRFAIDKEQLFRADLIKLAEDRHVLVLVMHHIISDGWSMTILTSEFASLYRQLVTGHSGQLKTKILDYVDYAQWQRENLTTGELVKQLEFWMGKLDSAPPEHSLPLSSNRPSVPSFSAGNFELTFNAEQTNRLRALARSLGVTLFALTQSAFSLLISLWSNEQKIVVGTPVANRTHKEVEEMVGFFVNTIPLYCEIDPNESFTSFVTKNSLSIKQCLGNQGVPFDLLVDRLKLARIESKNPLFQIVFALQDLRDSHLVLEGVSVAPLEIGSQGAKFDLNVQIFEHADGLSINWEYSSDLFDEAFIRRIAASYMTLLDELFIHHGIPMKQLKYLPEQEYAQLLALSNQQQNDPVRIDFIHQRFEHVALKYPNLVALSANGEELTYAELNQRANKVAHLLVKNGVKANQLVGLSFYRNTQLVVAILAILKAGGAYVPFDPAIPDERFNFIIEDSKIDVMLTESELANRFSSEALNLIVLDQASEVEDYPHTNLQLRPGLDSVDSLAYVIYTSGTTGKPKGVLVSHSNVVRLFDTSQIHYRFNEHDRWSLFHSSAFDVSVWEIWGALFYGGCVVVVPRETARSTEIFYQFVRDEGITVLSQTPSAFYVFDALDALNRSALKLRYIVFAGEALEFQKLQGWFARHGDDNPAMINMYGITETTVHSTFKRVMKQDLAVRSSNIGRPLEDLSVYVCNPYGQLVPLGTPGELLIGGAGVTHGYLGRPELTAERFIDNYFDAQDGSKKLYRSGDLVRFLPSGDMEYLGRIDKQVKLRGYRIELGEIEYQLRLVEGVDDAAVLLQRDEAGEALLAGYLKTQLPETQEGKLVDQVRDQVSQHLPEYMVPAYFICLPSFPITSNGKLDAQSLLKIKRKSTLPYDLVLPAEGLERQIAKIWALELGLEQVGANNNFFELGGNSLKIVALAAKLSNELSQAVTPVTLLRNPTVRQLADALDQSKVVSVGSDRQDTKLTQASRKDLMKKKLERVKK